MFAYRAGSLPLAYYAAGGIGTDIDRAGQFFVGHIRSRAASLRPGNSYSGKCDFSRLELASTPERPEQRRACFPGVRLSLFENRQPIAHRTSSAPL